MFNITKKKTYYKPTDEEINAIIASIISENTQKVTIKIETITNKEQLEKEMMEFILEICQVKTQEEYALSFLINCINLLSVYLLQHSNGSKMFNLMNKNEFRHLWKALNEKIKMLKKIRNVTHHYDNLTNEELQQIFNHDALSIDSSQGLQYHIFMWCCLLFQSH
ncbi:6988_t:CDS:2, partial [Cetraspora pellucida]